jgi:hypothetical protein
MNKLEGMTGAYSITYSSYDGGFYVELWWNDETSPVFKTIEEAYSWAGANGGTLDFTKPSTVRV